MKLKLLIFGNSGSGKSTLAKQLAELHNLAHLDLDTLAWKKDHPGEREDFETAASELARFCLENKQWVVEGCYADLLETVLQYASHIIFLNTGVEQCQKNCRNRPWETHKYKSKEEQDRNLEMLLAWVAEYETRNDEFSLIAHTELFKTFRGQKYEWKSNEEIRNSWMNVT